MISDQPSRPAWLVLTLAMLLLAVVAVALALGGFAEPGYAGSASLSRLLQATPQATPTPIPTPVAAACGVRVEDSLVIATDTASVNLVNDGAAVTLLAASISWSESNGDLNEVLLGDRVIWNGTESAPSTTIFPNPSEVLPNIKAGEEISLTLRFSNDTTNGRYVLLLHLGNGCFALFDSAQPAANLKPCFATFDDFHIDGQQAALVVRNTTTEPLTFTRLLMFWPVNRAAIESIQLGENLIGGPFDQSPIDVAIEPGVTLLPDQSLTLSLSFDKLAPLVDYSIVLQTDGCQSVFSNVYPPSECPVRREGGFDVTGQTVNLTLQNLGTSTQPVRRIWMTFPVDSNGPLEDVLLNNQSIVDSSSERFPKTTSPASMTAGVELTDASLAPNSQSVLSFSFQNEVQSQPYAVQVDFPNECRLVATTPAEEPTPCQMEVDGDSPLRTEGDQVWLDIHNAGDLQATLSTLTLNWDHQFDGALVEVALGDVLFWQGRRTGGSATVTYNGPESPPAVEPGGSTALRLTFEYEVVGLLYGFRLDFAEGCKLTYETQPGSGVPTPVEFGGTIHELPPDIFDGVWQVKLSQNEILSVQVTPQTLVELDPPGLIPRKDDIVFVQALTAGEGEYVASSIRVTANKVEWTEFTGAIDGVDPDPPVEYIEVQGVWVNITEATDAENQNLEVGWLADVEGYLRADGSVIAERIRTTAPQSDVRRVDFQGVVQGWTDNDPLLGEGESLWNISGLRVIIHQDTTVLHGILPGEQPVIGTEVQVAGNLVSSAIVRALELWYGSGDDIVEFDGLIRQLPDTDDPRFLGVWVIENSDVGHCDPVENIAAAACVEVLVTQSTFVDSSEAWPEVGGPVQVRARQNPDNNLEALWLKVFAQD